MIVVKVDQMFFKKAARRAAPKSDSTVAREKIESNRDEMKKRFEQIDAVNMSLCEASKKTQEVSIETTEKLNHKMKIPKKSLREISAKLHEGLVLINSCGEIIHVNRQGTKILGLSENEITGKKLGNLISCAHPIIENGVEVTKPILRDEFFAELSKKMLSKLTAQTMEVRSKYMICNDILKSEMPFCFEQDSDRVLGVCIYCGEKEICNLTVTLTVIDNDPDELSDITYLFLFSTTA